MQIKGKSDTKSDIMFSFQTKRGTLVVHVKWYFRFYEVPESVYLPLVQDRHTEDGESFLLSILLPSEYLNT